MKSSPPAGPIKINLDFDETIRRALKVKPAPPRAKKPAPKKRRHKKKA
jgi:hypothetical protein